MGLDIYFRKAKGGQSANDALTEKRKKLNTTFCKLLEFAKTMRLYSAKDTIKDFLWDWEWKKADKAQSVDELLKIVGEYYPQDKQDEWELRCEESKDSHYYFRKVNCIYGYCASNGLIEDGEVAMLDHEQMMDILKRAKEILSQPTEEDKLAKGKELLPTQGGFFFGSTYYNKLYLEDIAEVACKFEYMTDAWQDAYAVIFSW